MFTVHTGCLKNYLYKIQIWIIFFMKHNSIAMKNHFILFQKMCALSNLIRKVGELFDLYMRLH